MENTANHPPIQYPWGSRQEKLIGQLDANTYLSDKFLYSQNTEHDMQNYGHAKILRTSPRWLFFLSLIVAIFCAWAGVTAFNAWVRFDSMAVESVHLTITASRQWLFFFASLAASIVGFYVYNKLKRTWMDVFFNENKIRFNVTQIDPLDVSKFQRSLRIVKNGRYTDL